MLWLWLAKWNVKLYRKSERTEGGGGVGGDDEWQLNVYCIA